MSCIQPQKQLVTHKIFDSLEVMAAIRYGFTKWSISTIDQANTVMQDFLKWLQSIELTMIVNNMNWINKHDIYFMLS